MLQSIKDLIVVLAFALVIFRLAKPIAMHFTNEADYLRRRNVWLALTVVAFLSPSFWLFVAIAIPVTIWARRRDSNPVALYLLLLHVIPPMAIAIPIVGINQLFDLDNYRLLSFCILIPFALQLRRNKDDARIVGLQGMDFLVLGFGLLLVMFFVPPDLPNHVILKDSLTNLVRRALLFLVDVYALYFAVSRGCTSQKRLVDAMAAFCLACAVMAVVATFESARHWLLYTDIQLHWTGSSQSMYYQRGGVVRSQASAGHALALGYLLAVAFGFWLYLQTSIESRRVRVAVALLFWLGLIAAYSRGPWIGAVAVYLAFMAAGAGGVARIFKAAAVVVAVLGVISLTPLGDRILSVLPGMGGAAHDATVDYREALAARSWQLILEHPFFGDQLAFSKMEDLRQGEGIIDLVNTYAEIAVFHGLVGLLFFIGFVFAGLRHAYRTLKAFSVSDPDFSRLGASLVSCMIGTLFMLFGASFIQGYQKMFYVLGGFAAAYAAMRSPAASPAMAAV
jgi:hypothetical protein